MAEQIAETRPITEEGDFLQIKSIDHIQFWVGNAKHAMYYWWKGFGFKPVAYSGLETGNRQNASYVLESGQIRFVMSAPYGPTNEIAAHHLLHGDGVKVIALEVDDVEQAWQATTERGAKSAWSPREEKDEFGIFRTAAIQTYGETLHVFVDRSDYGGPFAPTYKPLEREAAPVGLVAVDHVVGNVQLGKMNGWVKFRINEPAEGKRKGQIEEYLDYGCRPGAQHSAMLNGDILGRVTEPR